MRCAGGFAVPGLNRTTRNCNAPGGTAGSRSAVPQVLAASAITGARHSPDTHLYEVKGSGLRLVL